MQDNHQSSTARDREKRNILPMVHLISITLPGFEPDWINCLQKVQRLKDRLLALTTKQRSARTYKGTACAVVAGCVVYVILFDNPQGVMYNDTILSAMDYK